MQYAALIAALIVERPLCLDCLIAKSNLTGGEVAQYLTAIGRALILQRAEDRCRVCGETVTMYSFARPTS